jgi:hypothetical protein
MNMPGAQPNSLHPIPTHYHPLGAIEGFKEQAKAVGIRIDHAKLQPGDRIAYELPLGVCPSIAFNP